MANLKPLRQLKSSSGTARSRRRSSKRKRTADSVQQHPLLHMQQTVGNHAVGRMLQAKLKIGQPGDRYEREADRVAEQVVSMPDRANSAASAISQGAGRPAIQRAAETEDEKRVVQGPHEMFKGPLEEEEQPLRRQPAAEEEIKKSGEEEQTMQRVPAMEEETKKPEEEEATMQRQPLEEEPKKKPEEEQTATLQTKSNAAKAPSVSPAVAGNINSMRGGGSPLPGPVRAYFEPRIGYDLSAVRVHTGDKAAGTAKAVNARAFTVGRDVVFGSGEYSPETTQGRKLLAHELAHVIQQRSTSKSVPEVQTEWQRRSTIPSPAQAAERFVALERLREILRRHAIFHRDGLLQLTSDLRQELLSLMRGEDLGRLRFPSNVEGIIAQMQSLNIPLIMGPETTGERTQQTLTGPSSLPQRPRARPRSASLPEWLGFYNAGMVGFHISVPSVPEAPLEAELTAAFRQRGVSVDSRLLQELLANHAAGAGQLENLLRRLLPAEFRPQAHDFSEWLATKIQTAQIEATLQRERPNALEQSEEQDERLEALLNPPGAATSLGSVTDIIREIPAGVSITIHF